MFSEGEADRDEPNCATGVTEGVKEVWREWGSGRMTCKLPVERLLCLSTEFQGQNEK